MDTESTFTVFFDGSFWVGVLEVVECGELRAAKVVFGSEPTPAELWEFTRTGGNRLVDAALRAPAVPVEGRGGPHQPGNPKRRAREVARSQREIRMTRSQRALAAAQEEFGKARRASKKERRSAEAEQRRESLIAKRKRRHRGK